MTDQKPSTTNQAGSKISRKRSPSVAPRKIAQQERSQQRVEHILAETLAMMSEGPSETITTSKIAQRTGVSIGTIYQFFPNKEAIYYELFRRWLEQTQAALDELIAELPQNADPGEFARVFLRKLADASLNSSGHWQLRLAMSNSKKLAKLETQHRQQVAQRILVIQAHFGRSFPAHQLQDLLLLQNEITIACLATLSRATPANRALVEDLCVQLLLTVFDHAEPIA